MISAIFTTLLSLLCAKCKLLGNDIFIIPHEAVLMVWICSAGNQKLLYECTLCEGGCIIFSEESHSSTLMSIVPAALRGSDVHSTHVHNLTWKETEREAISSVCSHAERFTVWNIFHMLACSFPCFFTSLCRMKGFGVCVNIQQGRIGKNM